MSDSHDSNDITRRVHDAVHMNVDLMHGPPRIVERALEVAGQVRRRRRRRRALAGALLITATVGTLAGVAVATRDDGPGVTITAGSSTTQSPSTTTAFPGPSAIAASWNTDCGVEPKFTPVPGLRFTLALGEPVVRPGASATPTIVLENTTGHDIRFGSGVGTWYVTTAAGRVVGTSAGYAVYDIGYRVDVGPHSSERPARPSAFFAADSGSCAGSEFDPPRPVPLEPGQYLAWFALPTAPAPTMFLSEPVPFEVAAGPAGP